MKQRLFTLDHDYQHAHDIFRKWNNSINLDPINCMKPIYNLVVEKFKNLDNKSQEKVKEGKTDILVLFYLLHENPFLASSSEEYFRVNSGYKSPELKEGETQKELNKRTKHTLSNSVFELVGYIHAFIEIYPEFKEKLEKNTSIIIDNKGKIRIPLSSK